ncbi:MAG TPA: subclass B3 metallo-beta-lactamase [Blastocatellia bacterium]|nr:subclass B3 metallo-beta-lactamase [Blastocatellia bacterium]
MNRNKFLFCAAVCGCLLLAGPVRTQDLSNRQSLLDQWNRPSKPFRIIGNINYVGTNNLACYLITTPAGHLLIDTAMEESAPIIRANIEALGFKLRDIKIMLASHAHFDHVAGHAEMKEATGARVYATAADAVTLESGGTKGFHPLLPYKPVKVDQVLRDGEVVKLGETALTVHLTPGHTEGNTTWTTTVEEGGKKYQVVFAASMSINPGVHLVNYAPWPGIAEAYAKSFRIMKSLPCEVFLAPHAPFFDLEAKVRRLNEGAKSNPFIDPEGYRKYLAELEESYSKQLLQERGGK